MTALISVLVILKIVWDGETINRTKIEYVDFTWNPITGCLNNCDYCYARKIAKRFWKDFKPRFHRGRLNEPKKVKTPSLIFADSMSDFWGRGVKQKWRDAVYETMKKTPQHIYLLLTKMPQHITDAKKIPENVWVGVSVSYFKDRWRVLQLVSKKQSRIFVSVEPILQDIVSEAIYLTNWIILGGLTGVKKPFKPNEETVREIISNCDRLKIPLFIKGNLGYGKLIRDYPAEFIDNTLEIWKVK